MKHKINKNFVEIKKGYSNLSSVPATIKSLSEAGKKLGGFIQIVSASCVVSEKQVLAALKYTYDSFEAGTNRLKSPELEFLLALTATRQLEGAISVCELPEGKSPCVLVVCAQDNKTVSSLLSQAKKITGFSEKKIQSPQSNEICKLFKISPAEINSLGVKKNALELLVLEKIALSRL